MATHDVPHDGPGAVLWCEEQRRVRGVTTRVKFLMDRRHTGALHVTFERAGEECLALTRRDWEEMGRPEVITLTIEPGDQFNA